MELVRTFEDYQAMPTMRLPMVSEAGGARLNRLECHCARCDRVLTDLRGRIVELPFGGGCFEVTGGGLCRFCLMLYPIRLRWYFEGRCLRLVSGGRWVEFSGKSGWLKRIIRAWRRLCA